MKAAFYKAINPPPSAEARLMHLNVTSSKVEGWCHSQSSADFISRKTLLGASTVVFGTSAPENRLLRRTE